jgi:exodeoxyribonuclease-3
MKICSWNINSIRVRVNALNTLIEKFNPDIILLQEIKCENHQFTEFFKNLKYNLIVKGQKGRHGVAILIKKNIDFTQIQITSNIMNKEARICGVSLKNIYIFNVYVPNGNPIENTEKYNFKLKWLEELSKIIEKYLSYYKNIIVAGDFNVLDHENDVKDFENWQSDALGKIETRKSFRKILAKGLSNVVRFFDEPGVNYSFWDYQKASWERNYGLLIDHFLVSPVVLQNTNNISFLKEFRDQEKPSDHIPVIIDMEN